MIWIITLFIISQHCLSIPVFSAFLGYPFVFSINMMCYGHIHNRTKLDIFNQRDAYTEYS